jgi:phage anti-repressor protein
MSIDDELKAIVLENAKSIRELKDTVKKVSKIVGSIGNNQGDVAEEFFYNSLKHKPRLAGIDYDFIYKNVTKSKDSIEDEYDMLLVNGKDIAIIETKYKAHSNDLDRLINKKYPNFKKLYPEYKDYNHHLGLASFKINDNLKKEALSNNIMILQRKGEVIETTLPKQ